jgi:hypothetical protein
MHVRYIIVVPKLKIKHLVDEQAGVYVVLVSEFPQDDPKYGAVFYGLCSALRRIAKSVFALGTKAGIILIPD